MSIGRCLCDTTEPHPVSECTRPGQTNDEVFADDVRAIVLALGLGDHGRPYSPHAVIHREVLPALAAVRVLHLAATGCTGDPEPAYLSDWAPPYDKPTLLPGQTGARTMGPT